MQNFWKIVNWGQYGSLKFPKLTKAEVLDALKWAISEAELLEIELDSWPQRFSEIPPGERGPLINAVLTERMNLYYFDNEILRHITDNDPEIRAKLRQFQQALERADRKLSESKVQETIREYAGYWRIGPFSTSDSSSN